MPALKRKNVKTRTIASVSPARVKILEEYSSHLVIIDNNASNFIKQAINETKWAYRVTLYLYIGSYVLDTIVLFAGLYLIFFRTHENSYYAISLMCILGGISGLFYLQNKSPIKNVRRFINNLAKLNVYFAGYMRQINQTDAALKIAITDEKSINIERIEGLLLNIQDTVDETIDSISQISNELNE